MMKNLLTMALLLLAGFSYGQLDSLGIIGSATPGDWAAQTNLTNDPNNTDIWTINIDLKNGEAKFRTDNTWATNWGAEAFPMGTGAQDGANIPICGGNFDVTFNSATGEYNFDFQDSVYAQVGLIGEAGIDWGTDIFLTPNPDAPWCFSDVLTLKAGECKFRADGVWMDEWADGGDGLEGVAAMSGGGNFVIPSDGDYLVELNTATGEYKFQSFIPIYETMGAIGLGAPSGDWAVETGMTKSATNPHEWSLQGTFFMDQMKFRGDSSWDFNWGRDAVQNFPLDTAVFGVNDNIMVEQAGDYLLVFNDTSGIYEFRDPLVIYTTIGIIGDATAWGWDQDIDMIQDPAQPDVWRVTLNFTGSGDQVKFRADNDWATNWGGTGLEFPGGTAMMGGDNITGVPSGTWEVTFNSTTGDFTFDPVSVAVVGPGSPDGNWPNDPQTDAGQMIADDSTGLLWYGTHELGADLVKFRKNNDWSINWGSPTDLDTLITQMAEQDGPNITISEAGTYDISLLVTQPHSPAQNEVSGEYSFVMDIMDNVEDIFTLNNVKFVPNPASELVTIQIESNEILQGEMNLQVFDLSGKLITQGKYDNFDNIQLSVTNFNSGTYLVRMQGENFVISKKLVVVK